MDLLGCLQSLLMGGKVYFNFKSRNSLSLDGKLPHGERPESVDLLGCFQSLLMGGEVLADGAGLLGPQIQRLVLLAGVELPQVVLLLLVHHDVNTGVGFPDDPDLGELGGGATSHLGHTELSELGLQVIELLGKVFLLLLAKLGALDLTHPVSCRSESSNISLV